MSDLGHSNRVNVRYERERAAGALALAQAAVGRMRQFMKPGTADSVASLLESDLETAVERVQWLRARASEEGEAT